MDAINDFIYNDPMSTVLMSFLTGLLFSGVSFGLIYVIIFLIIWEVFYFGYLDVNNRDWLLDERVTVILAALLGFLVGRFFHDDDDHAESIDRFKNDIDYYGRHCNWID